MKKYEYPSMYRGQQIFKVLWAKSDKDVSEKLDISVYMVKTYCYKSKVGEIFDGIKGYFDSGMLYREERSLLRQLIPIETLTALIDTHKDKEYNK
jgi:hypothetical protein